MTRSGVAIEFMRDLEIPQWHEAVVHDVRLNPVSARLQDDRSCFRRLAVDQGSPRVIDG